VRKIQLQFFNCHYKFLTAVKVVDQILPLTFPQIGFPSLNFAFLDEFFSDKKKIFEKTLVGDFSSLLSLPITVPLSRLIAAKFLTLVPSFD